MRLGRSDGNRETLLFDFFGDQVVFRLTCGIRQEPGRDDRCRLPGRHARDARPHNERRQVLVTAGLVKSLIDGLRYQAT
jgi:hypothetical protein